MMFDRELFFNDIDDFLESSFNYGQLVVKEKENDGEVQFQVIPGNTIPAEIEKYFQFVEPSFSDKLLEFIRNKGLNEVEVYKKADIDRRHFSKIRSDSSYRPTKDTVILLCLSMELSYEDTQKLLGCAGLTLSRSCRQDLIAEYFFVHNIYDVILYKEVLFKYGFIKE